MGTNCKCFGLHQRDRFLLAASQNSLYGWNFHAIFDTISELMLLDIVCSRVKKTLEKILYEQFDLTVFGSCQKFS